MIHVGLLTLEQKEEIVGQHYAPDSFFYPIQDAVDNWVISQEEMQQCCNSQFLWVKDLPVIEYQPKQFEDDII
jgi:hypothetical protein